MYRMPQTGHSLFEIGIHMSINTLLIALAVLAIIAYWSGVQRAKSSVGSLANIKRLHSRPTYHGLLMLFGIIVPAIVLLIGLSAFENGIAEHRRRSIYRATADANSQRSISGR